MKKLIFAFSMAALMAACGTKSTVSAELNAGPVTRTLQCVQPIVDGGYRVQFKFAQGASKPSNASVYKITKAATTLIAQNDRCVKLSSYDPQLRDGAQPEFACTNPHIADAGYIVELTDGDFAGRVYSNIYSVSRRGMGPVAMQLKCSESHR